MGVPSFYKWLVGKYPSIVSGAGKEGPDGTSCYDNLYLDMNCIIHQCFHPQDDLYIHAHVCSPTTFDEVFRSMFEYMDHLFRIIRPRKLLYLAVGWYRSINSKQASISSASSLRAYRPVECRDGVAPCAKMIGIRSGRFQNARNAKVEEIEEDLLRQKHAAEGKKVLPREISEVSDCNVITPGTEFMEKLSQALEYYIRARLNSDPGWKDITVILSDANVPGEGEDKIMSFIRAQRSWESYDPNTRHCVCGDDADLIMMALASHEVHFSILRRGMLRRNRRNQAENCISVPVKNSQLTEAGLEGKLPKIPYLFLNIWVLREYLELEIKIADPVCEPDFERLIDDFIFICFLMGNDFIPHIPLIYTHECAGDLLIEVYKTTFNKMGGYIVNTDKIKDNPAAYLNISRLEMFFHELSIYEEKLLLKRFELAKKLQCNILCHYSENERTERNADNVDESPDGPDMMAISSSAHRCISTNSLDSSDITKNTLDFNQNLEDSFRIEEVDPCLNEACQHDRTRLLLPVWKSRFYRKNFGVETSNEVGKLQNDMAQKYLEGLCWVLQCYFADVPSWSWYYPFCKAPFASDLKGLSRLEISFTVDKPLRPFDQLMAVLPPESSSLLPECYRKLVGCEESAIQTFYPKLMTDVTEGKRFLWHGITKSSFMDEELLLSNNEILDKELTMHEMRRNTTRQEKIFMRNSNALANNEAFVQTSRCSPQRLLIDSATSEIGGWVSPDDNNDPINGSFRSPIKNLDDITYDEAISATFFNPEVVKPIARLLDNVWVPDKTVRESDISKMPLWHTYRGLIPPCIVQRPDTIWKPSSPAAPREEHKYAGTGWMGRGRGNASATTAETQVVSSSSYGHGVANAIAAETQQSSSSTRGFRGVDMVQSRGSSRFDDDGAYSFRPHGGAWTGGSRCAGAVKKEQTAWRPGGSWARGSRGGNGGAAGRGGSGQPRGW